MARKKASLGGDISKSVKGTFSLNKFKAAKGLGTANNTFKEQEWIPLSPAWQEMVSLPGIPHGHITLLRGPNCIYNYGRVKIALRCLLKI